MTPEEAYRGRAAALAAQVAASAGPLRLAKRTSNLFRDRVRVAHAPLDVAGFDHVLGFDPAGRWMDVEGMTTYETATREALAHGLMPAVVPELKTITVGGAAAGVGIEATSFRHGLVHETIRSADILVGDGRIVHATPDNEASDLFHGFPNSYGTLGYALRLRIATHPVNRFVRVERRRFADPAAYFAALARACADPESDFVDGVAFEPGLMVLAVGRFTDAAPAASDYTFERIFWRSILEQPVDFLTVHDYIWRWDTDWFWCSKNLGMHNPLVRRLVGRARLGSRTYTRIMRWNSRVGLTRALDRVRGLAPEAVIQDVDIPIDRAAEFLAFFERAIGIRPVWTCPTLAGADAARFRLFPMRPGTLYVNFGFWDTVRTRERMPPGHFNRLIETEVQALGGIKSLYSDSFYDEATFWSIFDRPHYAALKARYDPQGRLGDLYAKCVLNDRPAVRTPAPHPRST